MANAMIEVPIIFCIRHNRILESIDQGKYTAVDASLNIKHFLY